MINKFLILIPFYLLVSCSTDLTCDDGEETVIIRENKVKKRIGYSYVPGSDSSSTIQSVEYFDRKGNLILSQIYMFGAISRQTKYEYDQQGRQLKSSDSTSNTYRVLEYQNSCDALKSTHYNHKNEILDYIEYLDSAGYKTHKQYNSKGELQNYSLTKKDKHRNILIFDDYKFEYNYDRKGNLRKQTRLYKGQKSTTVFERNDKGLILKQQIDQNGEYLGGSYFVYEYY